MELCLSCINPSIYTLVNLVIIGSGNDLALVQCQAITWTNGDIASGPSVQWNLKQYLISILFHTHLSDLKCKKMTVSEAWIFSSHKSLLLYGYHDVFMLLSFQFHVPWNVDHKTEQQHQIAMAMAYIHRSSKLALEGLHCHQSKEHKVFTPLTFKEYIHVFKVIAAYISKLELVSFFVLFF